MKLYILESASRDLTDGYWFYEKQSPGLGSYFIDSLLSEIDSLQIYAGIHPVIFGKYNRMLASRFPFAIYYHVEEDRVYISAVLDCRRNPAWTRERMK